MKNRSLKRSKLWSSVIAVLMITGLVYTASPTAGAVEGAQTWYVAPGASGDCYRFTPCGSVLEAIKRSSAGDHIKLASGNYGELYVRNISTTENFRENIVIEPMEGASVRFRTIRSYEPNITFSGFTVDSVVYFYRAADNNILQNSRIAHGYTTGSDNTQWLNNRIAPPIGEDGMQIKAHRGDNAVGTVIAGNEIGPAYREGLSHTDCVQLLGAHDTTISGNYMHECANTGVQIGSGATGTVKNVLITGNTLNECQPRRDGCDGYHAIIMGSTVASTVSVIDNVINGSVAISGTRAATPTVVGNLAAKVPCTSGTGINNLAAACDGIDTNNVVPSAPSLDNGMVGPFAGSGNIPVAPVVAAPLVVAPVADPATPEPVVIAPIPTSTSVPTATAVPAPTAAPVATVAPTATPLPVATAIPTATPAPVLPTATAAPAPAVVAAPEAPTVIPRAAAPVPAVAPATAEREAHAMPSGQGVVVDDHSQELDGEPAAYIRTFSLESGLAQIDVVVNGAWEDRSWAKAVLRDAAGNEIADGRAGPTASLSMIVPVAAGSYSLTVFSKPAPDVHTRVTQVSVNVPAPTAPVEVTDSPVAAPQPAEPAPAPIAAPPVTSVFTDRIHSKIPELNFSLWSGSGAVDLQFELSGAWRNRGWATMYLIDANGQIVASGSSNEGNTISLQTDVSAGRYDIRVTSRSGTVSIVATHPAVSG